MNETQYWDTILRSKKCKPITKEVEDLYLARCQAGDKRSEQRLVECNLKFVASVAKGYRNKGLDFSELMSEGAIGVQMAAQRFDRTTPYKFISYAVWWIRQRILVALSEQTRAYVIPPRMVDLFTKIEKTRTRVEQSLGRVASHDDLAKAMGMTLEDFEKAMTILAPTLSLDLPGAGSDIPLVEILPGVEAADDRAVEYLNNKVRDALAEALEPRDRDAWLRTHGLDGLEKETLDQIGNRYGVSRERIRQRRDYARAKVAKRAGRMRV